MGRADNDAGRAELSIRSDVVALPRFPRPSTWIARGTNGQLIAVVPEHQLVVAIGSIPTNDIGIDGDIWPWANDLIVPALE